MLKLPQLGLKSKLILILLTVSLGAILVVSYLGWSSSQAALTESVSRQLTSVRASKAYQIESYFLSLRSQIELLSSDKTVVEAMTGFDQAFDELNKESIPVEWDNVIEAYYTDDFFPRLIPNISGQPTLPNYVPESQASRYLQYNYIAANEHPIGEKYKLNDAIDGSQYSKLHTQYHPIFRNVVDKFGYYDFFLINFDNFEIVYSVEKEVDYATNLRNGPYKRSGLAEVVDAVHRRPDKGAVQVVDFQSYTPSYETPAAFFAVPIYDDLKVVGILALQLPVDEIDKIMTWNFDWESKGLGQSGESYLVGPDLLMRSISRSLVEQPEEYLAVLSDSGVSDQKIKLIEQFKSSTLLQKIDTEASRSALRGLEYTEIVDDYRDSPVMSAYQKLEIDGLDWVIMTEMQLDEVYQPVYAQQKITLVLTAFLVLLISLFAIFLANYFTKPISTLITNLQAVESGEQERVSELNSKDQFASLAEYFNVIIRKMSDEADLIKQENKEKETILLSILPGAVIQRLQKGETRLVETIESVTVLFSTVLGLTKLNEERGALEVSELLDELSNSLEALADEHDLETIEIVGESYMAACGLSNPHLDHVKRTVDYALETLETVERFNNRHGTNLSLSVGIDTGVLTMLVINSNKFGYDLWGETLNIASKLNTMANLNTVLVSQAVYEKVGDIYTFDKQSNTYLKQEEDLTTWVLKENKYK